MENLPPLQASAHHTVIYRGEQGKSVILDYATYSKHSYRTIWKDYL